MPRAPSPRSRRRHAPPRLIAGPFAVVSGGFYNTATGGNSSVSGSGDNVATGAVASVSGGDQINEGNANGWAAGGSTTATFHSP
jgi:hypothetical protein